MTLSQGAASRWRLEQGLRALDAGLRKRAGGGGIVVLRGARLSLHADHLLSHPNHIRTHTSTAYKVYSPSAPALRRHCPDRPLGDAPAKMTVFSAALPADLTCVDLASLDLAPDLRDGRRALEHFALGGGEAADHARLDAFFERVAGCGPWQASGPIWNRL